MSGAIARMGFRNAFRRKRVAIFTVISISISVSLLYTALSASTSLQSSANLFLQETLSPVDITVSNGGQWNQRITADMKEQIDRISGVTNTIPRIEEYVWVENGTENLYLILVGLDLQQEEHIGSLNATEGILNLSRNQCYLTREAITLLNISVGHELQLTTTAGFQFLNVSGYGLALDKGVIGPVVFVSLETAHSIYHIRYPDNAVGKLLVEVDDVFRTPSIVNHISNIVGDDFIVSNVKAYPLELASIFLNQARVILLALVVAACFIAMFRVFSAFAMVFNERRYETGVVLAFGAPRSKILLLLISEIGTIGFMGAILGGILGLAMGVLVIQFIVLLLSIIAISPASNFIRSVNAIDPLMILLAGVFGMLLTLIAGYLPAWRASRGNLVESLGTGPIAPSQRMGAVSQKTKKRIHGALIVLSILLVSLVLFQMLSDLFTLHWISSDVIRISSIPAFLVAVVTLSPRLANSELVTRRLVSRSSKVVQAVSRKNVRRNTLSGLIVFNLFVAVTVLFIASTNVGLAVTESWSTNLGWQTSSANVVVYMDPPSQVDFIEEVEDMANVTEAVGMDQGLGNIIGPFNTEFGLIMGIMPKGFNQLASLSILEQENESQGFQAINEPSTCILSEYTADSMNVGVGDFIGIGAATDIRIVGVCGSAVPVFVVSIVSPIFVIIGAETWENVREQDFAIGSILIDSSDPEATIADIIAEPNAHPVMVSSLEADYDGALSAIQIVVNASLATLFLATLASAFLSSWSIASTRRREIGMLSALGMTQSEIAQTLTAESASGMIAGVGVGAIIGFLVQVALSEIVVRFTGGVYSFIDLKIVLLVIISLMGSIGASYYAIANTTKTRVVGLLRDLGRGR
ncbi:MAG: ABC transporter permease [Candidatus Thorarchaeota archaeon]